jgi:hypothetical protein
MQTLPVGRVVKIKPEAQDAGDEKFTWVVIEDRGNRVLVRPLETGMAIPPAMSLLKTDLVDFSSES